MIVKFRAMTDPEIVHNKDYQAHGENSLTTGHSEVKTENELKEFLGKNSRQFDWKTVDYIQSCVKDDPGSGKALDPGVGKFLMVHFYAPINEEGHA